MARYHGIVVSPFEGFAVGSVVAFSDVGVARAGASFQLLATEGDDGLILADGTRVPDAVASQCVISGRIRHDVAEFVRASFSRAHLEAGQDEESPAKEERNRQHGKPQRTRG